MQCKRCLNTDESYFYYGSRGWYCRKCISFGRIMLEEEKKPIILSNLQEGCEEYNLPYALTKEQEYISKKCAALIDTSDVLLHCVCGAGKTELVIYSIAKMLGQRKKVCFAIPRRQVVLELKIRLQKYFPKAKIVGVCGGYTQEIDGDLIICTTHQLYRYYQAFDLLILDEPDAYPFKGDEVLHGIAKTACKDRFIYLTATPDTYLKKQVKQKKLEVLRLNRRPHGYDLCVPNIHYGNSVTFFIYLLYWIHKHQDKPKMIFVPTIALAMKLHFLLSLFVDNDVCTSKIENKDEIIEQFRKLENGTIITTTVLERGVTIPNVDICVYKANHFVFDVASLIQISGRVGRTMQYPEGEVDFLIEEKSDVVDEAINQIKEANHEMLIMS